MRKFTLCLTSEGKKVNPASEDCNIIVRSDLSPEDVMNVGRWDSNFWDPKFDEIPEGIPLGEFIPKIISKGIRGITYGAIVTGKKPKYFRNGIHLIGPENILLTGLDTASAFKVETNSLWDPESSRVYHGTLVLARSGVGSLGKSALYLGDDYINVSCFVDRIVFTGISPFYIDVFLKSKHGKYQIERLESGVAGTTNISFDEIKSIQIPVLPQAIQKSIEKEYKKIHHYHQLAMKSKKSGNTSLYHTNINMAVQLLTELIRRTEEVIQGERKSI